MREYRIAAGVRGVSGGGSQGCPWGWLFVQFASLAPWLGAWTMSRQCVQTSQGGGSQGGVGSVRPMSSLLPGARGGRWDNASGGRASNPAPELGAGDNASQRPATGGERQGNINQLEIRRHGV